MTPLYYNAFDQGESLRMQQEIRNVINALSVEQEQIVILCIGTDRATGDCLGPLVGKHLKQALPYVPVYGTLETPVHALNLEETIEQIYELYENPFIIAVDASLGIPEHIGYVTLSHAPLVPGKGVNKKLPAIGNLSITGIVNIAGFPNSILLQSTRLNTVMILADCISTAIYRYFTDMANNPMQYHYRPAPL